tara:strand:+ start:566 stop:1471 length:906 start_codon:yes stop_codon:yes gene_type:complete
MSSNLNVSIIIVTYKRIDCVKNLLDDLKQQSFKSFEVILISDGCNTSKDKSIRNYMKFFRIKTYDTGLDKEYGLARSRNLGINKANGDYCILLDDDCRIKENFVYEHYINRGKKTIIGGNRYCEDNRQKLMKEKMNQLSKLPRCEYINNILDKYKKVSLIENNISFYRKDIKKLGGFFDFIRMYGIVGQEFFFRASLNKFKYKYIKNASINHIHSAKEVDTNLKKQKHNRSYLANIFILPIIKNKLYSYIHINIIRKKNYSKTSYISIRTLIWILVILLGPMNIINRLISKLLKSKGIKQL